MKKIKYDSFVCSLVLIQYVLQKLLCVKDEEWQWSYTVCAGPEAVWGQQLTCRRRRHLHLQQVHLCLPHRQSCGGASEGSAHCEGYIRTARHSDAWSRKHCDVSSVECEPQPGHRVHHLCGAQQAAHSCLRDRAQTECPRPSDWYGGNV